MAKTIQRNNKSPSILSLKIGQNELIANINDGRTISIPLSWFKQLENASLEKLKHFEISPSGYGIHFPELDEDISIKSFIAP